MPSLSDVGLNFPKPVVKGIFFERENRFAANVLVKNQAVRAHVPSSGRMEELLVPGAVCYLTEIKGRERKTDFKLFAVGFKGGIVSIDSLIPNKLVHVALKQKVIPELADYDQIVPESVFGESRIDFLIMNDSSRCLVEVKSVTLSEGRVGLFPDAPSERGQKHLKELINAREKGLDAGVVFVVQREDADFFSPNYQQDPVFSSLLKEAFISGVKIIIFTCTVSQDRIEFCKRIPVVFY